MKRPNITRPALSKLAATLSAAILLASVAGTKQLAVQWTDTPLGALAKASYSAAAKGDFETSAQVALRGLEGATTQHHGKARLYFLYLLAADRQAQLRFAEALPYFRKAERAARVAGNGVMSAQIASNLTNLYVSVGDYGAAKAKAQEALRLGVDIPNWEGALRVTLGHIAILQGDGTAVDSNLVAGAELAERSGNEQLSSYALNELGRWKLMSGDLAAAEAILSAAFRRQLLQHDKNIAYSYLRLASLKLRQGDPEFALRLNDSALRNMARGTMAMAPYFVWQERGPILEALGRPREAADCYRRAIELARRWRADASPADRTQIIIADGLQGSVYDHFVSLASNLALKDKSESEAWEAFAALEENRAYTLANATRSGSVNPANIRQQEKVAALRAVEIRLARQDSPALRAQGDRFRREIDEANTLVLAYTNIHENFPPQNSLTQFKAGLSDSEAIFSFALSRSGCHRWAISRDGFTIQSLTACEDLGKLVARFREALENQKDATELGKELYGRLLGNIPLHAAHRANWLFSLDDALWELPLPALVVDNEGGSPVYLVERHSLTILPSALLRRPGATIPARGRLVGLGDPIYNLADARRLEERAPRVFALSAMTTFGSTLPRLNRLVASGGEVLTAADAWRATGKGQEAVILTGTEATRERLVRELARPTAAVHIAAHVLSSKTRQGEAVIAMSIDEQGAADAISAADISAIRVPGAIVILNGCSSGRGEIHRGAGLFGLTRAWLVAGAGGVIASQWDTPDDAAGLFPSFYRHWMQDSVRVAEALRRAQVDMLHSGTWRAKPGFWSAYSMTGVAQ